jgi:hypothetical protein
MEHGQVGWIWQPNLSKRLKVLPLGWLTPATVTGCAQVRQQAWCDRRSHSGNEISVSALGHAYDPGTLSRFAERDPPRTRLSTHSNEGHDDAVRGVCDMNMLRLTTW